MREFKIKCMGIIFAIGFIIIILQAAMLSYEINKLALQVEELSLRVDELSTEIESIKEEITEINERLGICEETLKVQSLQNEPLIFTAGDKILTYNETNIIGKDLIEEFKVESIYPIVAYKVIGNNGEVLQESYFGAEKQTAEAENYTFIFEGLTEEVTMIWLTAFDSDGIMWVSRGYNIEIND